MAPKGKGKAKAAPAPAAAFSAVPTLDEACALLLKNEPAPFREATETLFTILNNITAKPDEAVFRRLKRANAALSASSAVPTLDEACALLLGPPQVVHAGGLRPSAGEEAQPRWHAHLVSV